MTNLNSEIRPRRCGGPGGDRGCARFGARADSNLVQLSCDRGRRRDESVPAAGPCDSSESLSVIAALQAAEVCHPDSEGPPAHGEAGTRAGRAAAVSVTVGRGRSGDWQRRLLPVPTLTPAGHRVRAIMIPECDDSDY